MRYPGNAITVIFSHGRITIGGKPVQLVPSNNPKYPVSGGWLMFTYHTWIYYVHISTTGIKIVAVHGGKTVPGTVIQAIPVTSKFLFFFNCNLNNGRNKDWW